jgi:competence protein ComEC
MYMQSWTIVSAAGVFAVGWLPALPAPVLLLIGAGIIAILALGVGRRCLFPFTFAFLGLSWGAFCGHALLEQRLPEALEGIGLAADITVLEPPQWREFSRGGHRQRFAARVRLSDCPEQAPTCNPDLGRVLLAYYGEEALKAGDRWRAEIKLKRPRGLANPGSFNYEAWLARHRFVATGHIRSGPIQLLAQGEAAFHQRWRQAVADLLRAQAWDAGVGGVLLALSTGDRSGIDHALWQRFQRYGLNHLVVISGLHVGMVAGIGFLLGRLLSRRSAHLGAAGLALLYSALAGFAMPTVRALAMLASVQLAALAGRRVRPWRSLGLALLLIAVIDPLATHSAGFWLSFGAVALIFYLHGFYRTWPAWRLTLLLQVSLSLVMGVVASFWFGGLGWLAPLANLLAVPVLTFWLAPLCLAAGLLAIPWPAAAAWCWQLAALPVSAFLALDQSLEANALPLWLDYRPSLAALFSLLIGCLLLLSPRGWPGRSLAPLFLVVAILTARPSTPRDSLEFWLLDVGQGLASVLLAEGHTLVYDTGAGDPGGPNMATAVIAPFLQRRGISEIDLLVISHGDRDHASGTHSLHRQFTVKNTWHGEAAFDGLPRQRPCRGGEAHRVGPLELEVIWPRATGVTGNDSSCVIRVLWRGRRLLLPGDISADVERGLVREWRKQLAADVMVVPHHGSRSSSTSPLLAAVNPELVLLSRGYRNRFGHPHPDVVARYRRFGLEPCDTAGQGAIQVLLDSAGIQSVTGWRWQRRYYWSGAASPACSPAYNGALKGLHRGKPGA